MSHQSCYYARSIPLGSYEWKRCGYVYAFPGYRSDYRFGYSLCPGDHRREVVFTFIFVLVVLGSTDPKKGAGAFAGLAIGLSLVLVHIVCIPITGTSVNPARSIGPALFQGGEALSQLWLFIVAPFVGAAVSALVWNYFGDKNEKK